MNNYMEYNGYQGSVDISDEDQLLFGKVAFIPALISYEGKDVKSIMKSFHQAVDDYLELCREQSKEPAKPLKGSFNVRTRPDPNCIAKRPFTQENTIESQHRCHGGS